MRLRRLDGGICRPFLARPGLLVAREIGTRLGGVTVHLLHDGGSFGSLLTQLLHKGSRLGSKLALCPNRRTVLVEQKRERHAGQGKEGRDTGRPVDSQVFIHFPHKHGEGGSKQRTQDGVGCQNRRGENRVGVDEIVQDAQEHQDHAETKGHPRENADNPVNRAGIRPGKPEQAHGQGDGPDKRAGQTSFGRCVAAALALRLDVPPVQGESKGYGGKHSHHDAQKSQPPDALVPSAMLLVHNGERTKEHVQRAVHNGHVHREKKDDGLSE